MPNPIKLMMASAVGKVPPEYLLFTWGTAVSGQLGNNLGSFAAFSSPVQIGAAEWVTLGWAGNTAVGIKTEYTAWGWGENSSFGTVGIGTKVDVSSPTQIGSLTTWTEGPAGGFSTASGAFGAIQSGKLFMWGQGGTGRLGVGNVLNYSSPVQVGSLTTWDNFTQGDNFTGAVDTAGKLWTWGAGSSGSLGHGDVVSRSSPTQVNNKYSGGTFPTAEAIINLIGLGIIYYPH